MTLATRLPRRGRRAFALSAQQLVLEQPAGEHLFAMAHWSAAAQPAPAVVLHHGLAGSADSGYLLGTATKLQAAGLHAVRMNMRNSRPTWGPDTLDAGRTIIHSGDTSDLAHVMRHVAELPQVSEVYIAGFSLGGNFCLKLAGEWGAHAPPWLGGVIAVSPACELAACQRAIDHEPGNRLYRDYFLRWLKRRLTAKLALYPDLLGGVDWDPRALVRLSDYDDLLARQHWGFHDHADYYARASALPLIERIEVPTLIVQAADDTLVPPGYLEHEGLRANPWVQSLLTERGAHCAFVGAAPGSIEGWSDRDRWWAENRVLQFVLERVALQE